MIRIMSWNIHGGVGPDRSFNLSRIVERVRFHAPDIIAIQEIDSRRKAADTKSAFEFLAAALGPHSTEARLITAPDGDYGHAVVSRWPLSKTVLHDVSVGRREPRAAIETTIMTAQGPLYLVAAHLGLGSRERRRQVELLCKLTRASSDRTVVLGDFNDWAQHGSVRRALADAMPQCTHHKTFPAWLPLLSLDRIYCRPSCLLVRSWTDPDARHASDHLPIIADVDLSLGSVGWKGEISGARSADGRLE
jgi:endonuclease/exonuclease/phosphatase family metal-dependent hydrolase